MREGGGGGGGILGNVYVKLSSFSGGTILCPKSETCERPNTFTFWGSLMHSKTSNPKISAYRLPIRLGCFTIAQCVFSNRWRSVCEYFL